MQISENTVVSIHYTLKNTKGEIIDSSEGDEPLVYLHGANNIIPGLENELAGKSQGDKLEVTVDPELGYGKHQQKLVQKIAREKFEDIEKIEAGMRFHAQTDVGDQVITVIDVNDKEVTIDANHPLAGEILIFSVEIVELREATETEIEHGHIHHDCGCHH